MRSPSPAIAAAVRAIGGEADLDAVLPALDDRRLARVIACAPDADPVVRAVAALCGRLSDLLDPSIIADPALHAAMARLIGTRAGHEALRAWAEVAPAGWGRAHAAALIDAVRRWRCNSAAAAVLCADLPAALDSERAIRKPDVWYHDGDHLITALPTTPRDAGAFVAIASKCAEEMQRFLRGGF